MSDHVTKVRIGFSLRRMYSFCIVRRDFDEKVDLLFGQSLSSNVIHKEGRTLIQ